MASYDYGKDEIRTWVYQNMPTGATCLDVGAMDGKWGKLLNNYLTMDACEAWKPYIKAFGIENIYRKVFCCEIQSLEYGWYDLVIFGDVIEHLAVEDAQKVLEYAKHHSKAQVVCVPYLFPQGAVHSNPYQEHKQDDLTEKLFYERYGKDWEQVVPPLANYAYFIRKL